MGAVGRGAVISTRCVGVMGRDEVYVVGVENGESFSLVCDAGVCTTGTGSAVAGSSVLIGGGDFFSFVEETGAIVRGTGAIVGVSRGEEMGTMVSSGAYLLETDGGGA